MIRDIKVKKDDEGHIKHVRLVFGPHYFLELDERAGKVSLTLGATHHGFKADASEVGGELEQLVYEIRRQHPDKVVD